MVEPEGDSLIIIREAAAEIENERESDSVQALMIEELRRLCDGGGFGLRPSELERWKSLNIH